MKQLIEHVIQEVHLVLSSVQEEEAIQLAGALNSAKRIFVTGEGRSGLMGKAFAMRLMHGGYHVFAVGETITPAIEAGDLLVSITASGSTASVAHASKAAKARGARLAVITADPEAELARLSDLQLVIPAASKFRREHEPATIQPLGNQFDQSVHLLLDAIIMYALRENASLHEDMRSRHVNLE